MAVKGFVQASCSLSQARMLIKNMETISDEACKTIIYQTLRTMCTYIIKDWPYGKPELWANKNYNTNYIPGLSKNNFQISFNAPATEINATEDKEGGASIRSLLQLEQLDAEKTIYFTNPCPYASRIEFEGWSSKQRPEGAVRKNLAKYNQLLYAFAQRYKLK